MQAVGSVQESEICYAVVAGAWLADGGHRAFEDHCSNDLADWKGHFGLAQVGSGCSDTALDLRLLSGVG